MLIRIKDNKYPCTFEDAGNDNPSVAIPSLISDLDLREFGYAIVSPTPAPIIDPDSQVAVEITPVKIGDEYQQQWAVNPLPQEEIDAIVEAKITQGRILIVNAIQTTLDAVAQTRGYDHAERCISYIGDDNPVWDAEGKALKKWRSAVWVFSHGIEDQVVAGEITAPTVAEMLAGLPVLVWPA